MNTALQIRRSVDSTGEISKFGDLISHPYIRATPPAVQSTYVFPKTELYSVMIASAAASPVGLYFQHSVGRSLEQEEVDCFDRILNSSHHIIHGGFLLE